MKQILAAFVLVYLLVSSAFAAEPVKTPAPATKEQPNCVTKDKKGNCPPPPKSVKPTPKKKAEDKKEEVKK
jgi:hypothetical protein